MRINSSFHAWRNEKLTIKRWSLHLMTSFGAQASTASLPRALGRPESLTSLIVQPIYSRKPSLMFGLHLQVY
jgi:hypothetical protein